MDSTLRFARKLTSLARVRAAVVLLVAGFAMGACGDDVASRVMCGSAADCGHPTDMTVPVCCGGYCVASSSGCDSGYRYVTSLPQFGECVDISFCSFPDLSVAGDMSKPNADAGN